MAELVGINEGYEYQHNATKNRKSNIRNPRKFKFAILFEQSTYVETHHQLTIFKTCD